MHVAAAAARRWGRLAPLRGLDAAVARHRDPRDDACRAAASALSTAAADS